MRTFVDREQELIYLEEEYTKKEASLIILYGRRRVGKTALLSKFMTGKTAFYFLVTEETEQANRSSFKEMVADYTGNTLLKMAEVREWLPLFQVLADYRPQEKLVLMIDEFQYLGKSNPAFPSVFQKIWDTMLKERNVMVILCGSLISMMESQTLSYTSPLYGRRTGQIKLKQIPFRYYNEFFPDKSREELIECYAVTGGVPKYIELFESGSDIYSDIQHNILRKSSFLYDEPNFLLQREVTDIGTYYSIIKTIAAGNRKLGKIAAVLETRQTGITRYLKTLIDLDILEREVPITEDNPEKSKRGLYQIKDNFILFWFKFISPNLGMIETGHSDLAMQRIRQNFIDTHVSFVYEDICREKMWQLNAERKWDFTFEKVGRWWDNQEEIDLVALDSNGKNIIFGECKYWKGPVGLDILAQLKRKAKNVEWNRDFRHEYYVLFSIHGFTEELKEYAASHANVLLMD